MNTIINVVAAVIKKNDLFLVAKRNPDDYGGNMWEFPGGKSKENETFEDCLHREIKEELAVDIDIIKFLCSHSYVNNNRKFIIHFYHSKLISENFTLTSHTEIKWVTLNEMKSINLLETDKHILPKLEKLL